MAMNTVGVISGSFAKGTIPANSSTDIKMKFAPLPATVWVRPTTGSVTVAYSVDEGTNYTAITALTNATTYTDIALVGPITNLRITGTSATGTWGVC